jgi:hypothetical protein
MTGCKFSVIIDIIGSSGSTTSSISIIVSSLLQLYNAIKRIDKKNDFFIFFKSDFFSEILFLIIANGFVYGLLRVSSN